MYCGGATPGGRFSKNGPLMPYDSGKMLEEGLGR
jgi:hypothetical protein